MDKTERENQRVAHAVNSYLEEFRNSNTNGVKRFNAMLNLKLVECSFSSKCLRYVFDVENEWCLNQYNGLHGGVISGLMDTSIGVGAHAFSGDFVTTTDLNINYLKPAIGTSFYIDVTYNHIGKKIVRALASITSTDSGILCATAMAGFLRIEDVRTKNEDNDFNGKP